MIKINSYIDNRSETRCEIVANDKKELEAFRNYCLLLDFDPWSEYVNFRKNSKNNFFNYPVETYIQWSVSKETAKVLIDFYKIYNDKST